MKYILAIGILAILFAAVLLYMLHHTASGRGSASIDIATTSASVRLELAEDAYPLYDKLVWKEAQATTTFTGTETVSGAVAVSEPIANVTDLASYSQPFVSYYADKLVRSGWEEDTSMAADGAGSSVQGYKKNGNYVIVSYSSAFKNDPGNEPAQCPCDITFRVFSTLYQ